MNKLDIDMTPAEKAQRTRAIKKAWKEYELLTREEAADFLKINLSTLHAWQNKGLIRAYHIERRVYFLRNELIALPKEVIVNRK